ncbi:MAG: hypothetical protein OWQ57_02655, partial [Sulfobacillus sp.]|nr:hypothetical protein [Sulfobacillus sp.]
WAGQRGWTVPAFKTEIAALVAWVRQWADLTEAQRDSVTRLEGEGVPEATAFDLAATVEAETIRRYVDDHQRRRQAGERVSAAGLVRAIRERRPLPPPETPLPLYPGIEHLLHVPAKPLIDWPEPEPPLRPMTPDEEQAAEERLMTMIRDQLGHKFSKVRPDAS